MSREYLSTKSSASLIEIQHVDIVLHGQMILQDITWSLREGENWGVRGGNGSGKSTFLRLVRGDLWPAKFRSAGRRRYRIDGTMEDTPIGMRERIGYVSPEAQDLYAQNGWNPPCRDAVAAGLFDAPLLYGRPDAAQRERVEESIERFHLESLADRPVLELSRGEMRKVLLARAWVRNPFLLILDECCHGLDPRSRAELLSLVARASSDGIPILYAGHRADEVPETLTHTLRMKDGRIAEQGPIERRVERPAVEPVISVSSPIKEPATAETKPKDSLIRIENASVWIGRKKILHEIHWSMGRDENWAVVGPNGSGKSTLLKLIAGDYWPELGGKVFRFGQDGDLSVAEARRRMGVVSPELQALYSYNLTTEEVVVSGLFASIGVYENVSEEQHEAARRWMDTLEIGFLAEKEIRSLSYGELRKVLLARAMAGDPELLILDEPFDGLDAPSRESVVRMVDEIARNHARVILVTHHGQDLLPAITHVLEMREGRIAGAGERQF